jgi:hypothetical protein
MAESSERELSKSRERERVVSWVFSHRIRRFVCLEILINFCSWHQSVRQLVFSRE